MADQSGRRKLSRKDFVSFVSEFSSNSTIHGLNHIVSTDRHAVEIVLWIGAVTIASIGAVLLSWSTWRRFQDNPTVISIEVNYYDWETDLPSLFICHDGDLNKADLFKSALKWIRKTNESVYKVMDLVGKLKRTFLSLDPLDKDHPLVIPHLNGIKPWDYLPIMQSLFNISKPSLQWSGRDLDFSGKRNDISQIITDRGICYSAFNQISFILTKKYWKKQYSSDVQQKEVDSFKGTPLDGDLFATWEYLEFPYQGYVTSPNELMDVAGRSFKAFSIIYKNIDLKVLSIYSSDLVKQLSIKQRKCRLKTESNLQSSPIYTFQICRSECRAKLAHQLCKCHPFFYRPFRKALVPLCNEDGLTCIHKNKEVLAKLRFSNGTVIKCSCLQNCDDNYYISQVSDTIGWGESSQLMWRLMEYPKQRLRRNVVFGWSDLLVGIGGTGGLFLGCSLLSFVEIFYYFTLRLLFFIISSTRISITNQIYTIKN